MGLCWCVKGLESSGFFWCVCIIFWGFWGGFFFFFFGVWVVWKGQKLSKPRFFGAACNFVLVLLFGLFVVGKLWGGFFWGSGMGRKFCRVLKGIVSRFFFFNCVLF